MLLVVLGLQVCMLRVLCHIACCAHVQVRTATADRPFPQLMAARPLLERLAVMAAVRMQQGLLASLDLGRAASIALVPAVGFHHRGGAGALGGSGGDTDALGPLQALQRAVQYAAAVHAMCVAEVRTTSSLSLWFWNPIRFTIVEFYTFYTLHDLLMRKRVIDRFSVHNMCQ